MSKFKKDFVNEDIVYFKVDGRKFGYIPVTAGDESDWLMEYTFITDKGEVKQNLSVLNKLKICSKLEVVPYDKEDIKAIINIDKSWKELSLDERWALLRKLRPKLFDEIVKKINDINNGSKKKTL